MDFYHLLEEESVRNEEGAAGADMPGCLLSPELPERRNGESLEKEALHREKLSIT